MLLMKIDPKPAPTYKSALRFPACPCVSVPRNSRQENGIEGKMPKMKEFRRCALFRNLSTKTQHKDNHSEFRPIPLLAFRVAWLVVTPPQRILSM
jgi:hypothetical protein